MFGLGYPELIVILIIVLLLFGGRKIPELARSLGQSIKEFRSARQDVVDAVREEDDTKRNGNEQKTAPPAVPKGDAPAAAGDTGAPVRGGTANQRPQGPGAC